MSMPLDPDKRDRDELSQAVLSYLDTWHQDAGSLPAIGTEIDDAAIERLMTPPGDEGRSIHSILDDLEVASQPGIYHPSGGHMSYIPGAGLYSGALADLLATGLNRYTGVAAAAPGMTAIEHGVVRWMLSLFDLGDRSAGLLLSGGSMANFSGIVAARTARLGETIADGIMYVSPHTHHSVAKAARLAGLPGANIRTIPVDDDLRMRPDALLDAIRVDRARKREPFLIVGSAGTTDTGTIDPLPDLAAIAAAEGLWLHVDGAYGAFFQLTERGSRALAGIEAADSISLDPHKGLSIPFGVGALLVRDEAHLIEANKGRGAYLRDEDSYQGLRDIASLGPELSRPNRGLQVWLPLQLHGVSAFRDALDSSLDLAGMAHQRLTGMPGVRTPWDPDLSIVAFGFDDDEAGRRAHEAILEDRRGHVSPTMVEDRFILRLAILNRRTTEDHVSSVLDIIERVVAG
jgi:aromatic-L-amino-acid decarboxylase